MSSFEQLFFRLVFSLLILFSTMVYMRRLRLGKKKCSLFCCNRLHICFLCSFRVVRDSFWHANRSLGGFGLHAAIFTAVISFAIGQEKPALVNVMVVLLGVVGAFLISGLDAANPQISPGIVFPVLAGFLFVEEESAKG